MAIHGVLKAVYIAVAVFSAIILGAVLIVIWTMPNLPEWVIQDELCLPESPGKGALKCHKVEDSLSHYLNKRLKELDVNYTETEYKRIKEERENTVALKGYRNVKVYRRPSARFTGKDVGKTTDNNGDMTLIRNWHHGKENIDFGGFARYGIEYQEGRVTVPLTGLYLIYSLLDMFEPCDKATGLPQIKLFNSSVRHSIYRYNVKHGVEEEIASTSIPHQLSKFFRYNYYSSYVPGLLYNSELYSPRCFRLPIDRRTPSVIIKLLNDCAPLSTEVEELSVTNGGVLEYW